MGTGIKRAGVMIVIWVVVALAILELVINREHVSPHSSSPFTMLRRQGANSLATPTSIIHVAQSEGAANYFSASLPSALLDYYGLLDVIVLVPGTTTATSDGKIKHLPMSSQMSQSEARSLAVSYVKSKSHSDGSVLLFVSSAVDVGSITSQTLSSIAFSLSSPKHSARRGVNLSLLVDGLRPR